MGIRIPQNQIVKSKYTAGKKYMFELTHKEYIGYYYELNNKTFAGKEFNSNAPLLIKIIPENINGLLAKAATYVYGRVSKVKLNNSVIKSHLYQYDSNVRYFSYQINAELIKEINQETFDAFKSNPLYIVLSLSYADGFNNQELSEAEKKIPGITTFVNTSYTNPQIEDDGTIG